MSVKLAGRLPDTDRNGLDRLQGVLVNRPEERHLVIAVIDCATTKVDHSADGDIFTPTAGVLFIEPITDRDDKNGVLDILARVRAERLDDATLDFDFGVGDPLRDAAEDLRRSGATVSFMRPGDVLKHGQGVFTEGDADADS
ncbi:hypothetical protein QN355_06450 [Cryobacterium sp. 10S3]|uniref:hypothetical protein n=1 Tax=Cryobacterium sp. 10S3 TaxID=3048582 RepID=UPI002AC91747|nr:hypothetical protein [Cryobacterium sp. 10S3]MEB0286189.1 hypothetical protein [Cryobacterium sp. 10S3]WPX12247.1 hypothetical protein RHM57_11190 [Cryobacterium sp. 10S3]